MKTKKDIDVLVNDIKMWLGEPGISYFKSLVTQYGTVNAVFKVGKIPYAVHFHEGMKVRNKMRELTNNTWSSHEYDDNWVELIQKCIE